MERLSQRLLGVAKHAKVVDVLLQNSPGGRSSYFSTLRLGADPTEAVGFDQARNGGQAKAIAIAISSKNGALLDRMARKEHRLTVLRAIAENKNTTPETLEFLLSKCLKRYDEELADNIARKVTVTTAVRHLEGKGIPFPMLSLASNITDRENAVLALSFPDVAGDKKLAAATLKKVAAGDIEGVRLAEALAMVENDLEPRAIANALTEAYVPLTVEQAAFLKDHYSGYQVVRPELTVQAARMLARDGDSTMQVAAVRAHHNDLHVLKHATKSNSYEVFELLASLVARPEAISILVERLIAKRETLVDGRSYRQQRFACDAGEKLLKRGVCPPELVVPLLRSDSLHTTFAWLTGSLRCKPQPGQISELMSDPGSAFTDRYSTDGTTSFLSAMEARDFPLNGISAAPWAMEFFENAPGIVKACSSAGNKEVLTYVYDRLYGAFGDDGELWRVALTLAESSPCSLSEFIKLVATSAAKEITGTVEVDASGWVFPPDDATSV